MNCFPEELPKFGTVEAGNYPGICCGVLLIGTHEQSYMGEEKDPAAMIRLLFELPSITRSDGTTHLVGVTYKISFGDKANFQKALVGWIGSDWHSKLRGKPMSVLLGLPAMVNLTKYTGKNPPFRKGTKIGGVAKFPNGFPAPQGQREHLFVDIADKVLPATLTAWDAGEFRKSLEYQQGGFQDFAPVWKPRDQEGGETHEEPAPPPATAPRVNGNGNGNGSVDNRTFEQFARAGVATIQKVAPSFDPKVVLEDVIYGMTQDGLLEIPEGEFPFDWPSMVALLDASYVEHRARVRKGVQDAVKYHLSKIEVGDSF